MKLLTSFEDPALVQSLAEKIRAAATQRDSYAFMEVCGTHTQALGRWALRSLFPEHLRMVSGPGCPVCVTPGDYIDNACSLALEHDVIIATYGDLIRVPGTTTSLEQARSQGGDIRVVYSAADTLTLAQETKRDVVFLAIGFETTAAGIAASILSAHKQKLENLSFYLSLRTVPPALDALISDPALQLDGFLLPGHVSSIIGAIAYEPIAQKGVPGVIAGFEPVDILQSLLRLIELTNQGTAAIENCYPRAVRQNGNTIVQAILEQCFTPCNTVWRGIGTIPRSGYTLKESYTSLDAAKRYSLAPVSDHVTTGCQCGDVLKGIITPNQCALFGSPCTPLNPIGPCMVSGEGSCAAYFKYECA